MIGGHAPFLAVRGHQFAGVQHDALESGVQRQLGDRALRFQRQTEMRPQTGPIDMRLHEQRDGFALLLGQHRGQ